VRLGKPLHGLNFGFRGRTVPVSLQPVTEPDPENRIPATAAAHFPAAPPASHIVWSAQISSRSRACLTPATIGSSNRSRIASRSRICRSPRQTTGWEGVRNFQAPQLHEGNASRPSGCCFNHSSTEPPTSSAPPLSSAKPSRSTAWDPTDVPPRSEASPRIRSGKWSICGLGNFRKPLALDTLRGVPALAKMELLRKARGSPSSR